MFLANQKHITLLLGLLHASLVIMLTACDVATITPNAGDVSLNTNDGLITDDEFAPKLVNIVPYEQCQLDSQGGFDEDSCITSDVASKTVFDKVGVRFLFEFDAPVYYDQSRQGAIELTNAQYLIGGAEGFELSPVVLLDVQNDGQSELAYREVEDAVSNKRYSFFTTQRDVGLIVPVKPAGSEVDKGKFIVKFPDNMVYAINPGGKKIFNKGLSGTYNFDNDPPVVELIFDKDTMNVSKAGDVASMSSSANDLDGLGLDFSKIEMTLKFEERVEPVDDIPALLEEGGIDIVTITCKGCSGGAAGVPYNRGYLPQIGLNGVTYVGTNAPLYTEYKFLLQESDVTGDNLTRLTSLPDGSYLTFTIKKDTFRDAAGNTNRDDLVRRVQIDTRAPQVNDIEITTQGVSSTGATILGIGDRINFEVVYSELVIVPNYTSYSVDFDVDNVTKKAYLVASQRDGQQGYSYDWTFSYNIEEGDGSNANNLAAIGNANQLGVLDIPGRQFTGDRSDALGNPDEQWNSDFSLLFGFSSINAFDKLLLPVEELSSIAFSDSRVRNASLLNNVHVDGIRPEIVFDRIESLSKIASGIMGEFTDTVATQQKLAVAVPMSENILANRYPSGIDFSSSDSVFNGATVLVSYCENIASNSNDCVQAADDEEFVFDAGLTQSASAQESMLPYQYKTAIFSRVVNESLEGVKSVVVQNFLLADTSLVQMNDFTDFAGNAFSDEFQIREGDRTGMSIDRAISIRVEGSVFGVISLSVAKPEDTGYVRVSSDLNEDIAYNVNESKLYVAVDLTKQLVSYPTEDDAVLTLRISDGSTERDIQSDSVTLFATPNGDINNNELLFTFNLTSDKNPPLLDLDGVYAANLAIADNAKDKFRDLLDVALDTTLRTDMNGRSLDNVRIDTQPPQCTTPYITTNSDGTREPRPYKFGARPGYAQDMYVVISCDQPITYNKYILEQTSITPFLPVRLANYDFISTYVDIVDQTNIVLHFPVQMGLNIDTTSNINIGVQGRKSVNWYSVNGNREGDSPDDHVFFSDENNNAIDTSNFVLADDYLISETVYGPDATVPDANNAIYIDNRIYPINIRYPDLTNDFANNYKNNGEVYLSGNPDNDTNSFNVQIEYARWGGDSTIEDIVLNARDNYNVVINLLDESNTKVGELTPFTVEDNVVTYSLRLAYGNINDISATKLDKSFSVFSADKTPYLDTRLKVFSSGGQELPDPVFTQISIARDIVDDSYNTNIGVFPPIRINNSRPDRSGDVRIFYDTTGLGVAELKDLPTDVSFGNIYVVVSFTKPMRETSATNFYLPIVMRNSNDVSIDVAASDIVYVSRDEAKNIFGETSAISITDNNFVYRFGYYAKKYESDNITINPKDTGRLFAPRIAGLDPELIDLYGNAVDKESTNFREINVSQAANFRSNTNISLLRFNKNYYTYNETMELVATIDKQIDIREISSATDKALALKIRVYGDEDGADKVQESIYAYARSSDIVLQRATAQTDGTTDITFRYTFSGIDQQYNSETTTDLGLMPEGSVQICTINGTQLTECVDFATEVTDVNDSVVATAVLTVDASSIQDESGVNSVLSTIVMTGSSGANYENSGLFGEVFADRTGDESVNYVVWANNDEALEVGDALLLAVQVSVVNRERSASVQRDNTLVASSSNNRLRFSIYNGVVGRRVFREATYFDTRSVANGKDQIRYRYVVEQGDVVHILNAKNQLADTKVADKVVSIADLNLQFDSDNFFTDVVDDVLDGITDSIYGNPIRANILDTAGSIYTQIIGTDATTDIAIDTRTSVVKVVNNDNTSSAGYTIGDSLTFYLEFSDEIEARGAYVVVNVGGEDVTADLDNEGNTNNTTLRFRFTVPQNADGNVVIPSGEIGLSESSSFIRLRGTSFQIKRDIPNNITVPDLTINSTIPSIDRIRIVNSDSGTTGVYSNADNYNGSDDITIELGFSESITLRNATPDQVPYMLVSMDAKDGQVKNYRFDYNGSTSDDITGDKFLFSLPIGDLDNDNINDYDGLAIYGSHLLKPASVLMRSASGNNLDMTISNTIKSEFSNFDISVDTSFPAIAQLVDASTGELGGVANLLDGDTIRLAMHFDEPIRFTNSSGANYALEFRIDTSNDSTTLSVPYDESDPSNDDAVKIFSAVLAQGLTDLNGIDLLSFSLTTDIFFQDIAGKRVSSITNSQIPRNFSRLRVDTVVPRIIDTAFVDGVYGPGSEVELFVTFSEDITFDASNSDDVRLQVDFSGDAEGARSFVYNRSITDRMIVLSFVVQGDVTADGARVQASVPAAMQNAVTDLLGNSLAANISADLSWDSAVEIDTKVSAGIIDIRAFVNVGDVPNTFPQRISRDDSSPRIRKKTDSLYLEVVFSENVEVNTSAGVPTIVLQDDNGVDIVFRYDATVDIADNDSSVMFAARPIPSGLDAKNGVTVPSDASITLHGGTIRRDGSTQNADVELSGNFENDTDNDGILETVRLDTLLPTIVNHQAVTNNPRDNTLAGVESEIRVTLTADEELSNLTGHIYNLAASVDSIQNTNATQWRVRRTIASEEDSSNDIKYRLVFSDVNDNTSDVTLSSTIDVDTIAPTVTSRSSTISTALSPTLQFTEDMYVARNAQAFLRDSQGEELAVIEGDEFVINGNEVTLRDDTFVPSAGDYFVQMPNNTLIDKAGNFFAGFVDPTGDASSGSAWAVTFGDAPRLLSTNFVPGTNVLVFIFSMDVRLSTDIENEITITTGTGSGAQLDASVVDGIRIATDNAQQVEIDLDNSYNINANFYVDFSDNAVRSLDVGVSTGELLDVLVQSGIPYVNADRLRLNKGDRVQVTDRMLEIVDADTTDDSLLMFTIQNSFGGEFQNNSNTQTRFFSMQNIRNNEVWFSHDGTNVIPYFVYSVSDDGQENNDESRVSDKAFFGYIPGTPTAHWDAQDVDNNTATDPAAGDVQQWADKRGNVVTSTSQAQYRGGQPPALDMDGVNGLPAILFARPSSTTAGALDYCGGGIHGNGDAFVIENSTSFNQGLHDQMTHAFIFRTGADVGEEGDNDFDVRTIFDQGGTGVGWSASAGYVLQVYGGRLYVASFDSMVSSIDLGTVEPNTTYIVTTVLDATATSNLDRFLTAYVNGVEIQQVRAQPLSFDVREHDGVTSKDTYLSSIGSVSHNSLNVHWVRSLVGSTLKTTCNLANDTAIRQHGYFDGHIGEILYWLDALSGDDLTFATNYLINRWAVQTPPVIDLNGVAIEGNDVYVVEEQANIASIFSANGLVADTDGTGYERLELRIDDGQAGWDSTNNRIFFGSTELTSLSTTTPDANTFELPTSDISITYTLDSDVQSDVLVTFRRTDSGLLTSDELTELLEGIGYRFTGTLQPVGVSEYTNIALGKPSRHSSLALLGPNRSYAGIVVDDDTTDSAFTHSYNFERNDSVEWLRIDLGRLYDDFESIHVFNRPNCCTIRLSGARLYLSQEQTTDVTAMTLVGTYATTTERADPNLADQSFDLSGETVSGRYFYLFQNNDEVSENDRFLNIREVRINARLDQNAVSTERTIGFTIIDNDDIANTATAEATLLIN